MGEIWKYKVTINDYFTLIMPKGAEVLAVQVQHGKPCLWARLDPNAERELRHFVCFGTGNPIPNDDTVKFNYVSTFQIEDGKLVFHLFEGIKINNVE